MKKLIYVFAALMVLPATSCSESSDPTQEPLPEDVVKPVPMSIGAAVAETRLDYERSADNKTITVRWSDTDALQVFKADDTNSFVDFTMQSHTEQTAVFQTNNITPLNIQTGDDITAIYPSLVASLESDKGTKEIKMKDQTIQANGDGDPSMDIMVAHGTWQDANTSLLFTHLMGSVVVVLNFDEPTTVSHIMLSADGGFNNYATIKMTADGGTALGGFKKGPMSATTTDATASTQYTGQIFVIPGIYSNISVTAITDRGYFVCTKAVSGFTLEQGKNYRLQVQSDAWKVAPLYVWGPNNNYAVDPGYNEMTAASDNSALYFLGNKDNYDNCTWSSSGDNLKFTLTILSENWSVFMGSSPDNFGFYPEYNAPYYPTWGNQNVLRVDVLKGEVKTARRRPICYVGNSNGWDGNSYDPPKYELTCDIDNENRIDEFTVRGLVFNNGDEIKFPIDDYVDVWNGQFIKPLHANESIYDGAVLGYQINYTNSDIEPYTDLKFKVNSADDAGTYDITINIVDETVTFTKHK